MRLRLRNFSKILLLSVIVRFNRPVTGGEIERVVRLSLNMDLRERTIYRYLEQYLDEGFIEEVGVSSEQAFQQKPFRVTDAGREQNTHNLSVVHEVLACDLTFPRKKRRVSQKKVKHASQRVAVEA